MDRQFTCIDGEITNAFLIDAQLRGDGQDARPCLVEGFGQAAFDPRKIACQRELPAVGHALRRTSPGKLSVDAIRHVGLA
jgi:hypothetical protein